MWPGRWERSAPPGKWPHDLSVSEGRKKLKPSMKIVVPRKASDCPSGRHKKRAKRHKLLFAL